MSSFTLRSGQISLIGVLWQGERNPLSPLFPYGSPDERESAMNLLSGTGVLDSNGDIDKRLYPLMDFLQSPFGVVRLCRTTYTGPRDIVIYTDENKKSVVIFSDETDSETLTESPRFAEMLSGLGFDEVAPNDEINTIDITVGSHLMQVMAAIYDRERQALFSAIDQISAGSGFTLSPVVHTADSVRTFISTFKDDPKNGFFLMLLSGFGLTDKSGSLKDPVSLLGGLETTGLLQKSGTGYCIPYPQLPMVRRTTVLDTLFSVDINRITDNGGIVSESALCIRADGALLWFILEKENPGRILMKYVSSGMETEILQQLVSNPAYFLAQIKVPPSLDRVQKKMFCPQCGAARKQGTKFCYNCGAKLS